ncbi:MAG TPA: hypothetical protein VKB76_11340 [Ktedonobacterales bacterium]|nr:hypothetical protein [Ktedonobacterales bacterium]
MVYPSNEKSIGEIAEENPFSIEGIIIFLEAADEVIWEEYEEQRRDYEYKSDPSNWSYPR